MEVEDLDPAGCGEPDSQPRTTDHVDYAPLTPTRAFRPAQDKLHRVIEPRSQYLVHVPRHQALAVGIQSLPRWMQRLGEAQWGSCPDKGKIGS